MLEGLTLTASLWWNNYAMTGGGEGRELVQRPSNRDNIFKVI